MVLLFLFCVFFCVHLLLYICLICVVSCFLLSFVVNYLVVYFIVIFFIFFFFFKQKTAYEMRISDWSSDVCSSDLTEIKNCSRFISVLMLYIATMPVENCKKTNSKLFGTKNAANSTMSRWILSANRVSKSTRTITGTMQ